MSRVAAAFWNPIVAKEYRSRMRTWRSPLVMMVYVLLVAGLGFAVFSAIAGSISSFGGGGNYGQALFIYLVLFQMVLLTFITPALTAGAISGERERQTIDLLFVTRIPPFSIIWGKAPRFDVFRGPVADPLSADLQPGVSIRGNRDRPGSLRVPCHHRRRPDPRPDRDRLFDFAAAQPGCNGAGRWCSHRCCCSSAY